MGRLWRSERWAMVEAREMRRLWRLERWAMVEVTEMETVMEIREVGGCGDQRDGAMVEAREMGRWWSKRNKEVRKRIEDGMKEDET